MTEKAAEARRKYKREWAKANPDKVKRYQATYWEKRAQAEEEQPAPETMRQAG